MKIGDTIDIKDGKVKIEIIAENTGVDRQTGQEWIQAGGRWSKKINAKVLCPGGGCSGPTIEWGKPQRNVNLLR